jgi:signal peptidase I
VIRTFKTPIVKEIVDWAVHILAAVALGLLIVNFVAQRTVVDKYSMEPTLMQGDNLLVEKISPKVGYLHVGDIVTVYVPEHVPKNENPIIKRIIAMENDTVEIKDGKVYVNNIPKNEPYTKENYTGEMDPAYSKMTVPRGQIYILGDNRANSLDSRTFGSVPVARVRGKALFRFFPFNKFGTLAR